MPKRLVKHISECVHGVFSEMTGTHPVNWRRKTLPPQCKWHYPIDLQFRWRKREKRGSFTCVCSPPFCLSGCSSLVSSPVHIRARLLRSLPWTLTGAFPGSASYWPSDWHCSLGPFSFAASSILDLTVSESSGCSVGKWPLWTWWPLRTIQTLVREADLKIIYFSPSQKCYSI